MTSVWDAARMEGRHPALPPGGVEADVVVIGGGITGLTTALRLAEAGRSVVVLEAHTIGGGSTGGSTGNLYSTLARGLAPVRDKWGDRTAREVVAARARAIDAIEDTVQRFNIDCQFQRRPLYRILPVADERRARALDREREAMERAGATVSPVRDAPLPMPVRDGLKLEHQAQFNPLRYVQGLASAVKRAGGAVHEQSRVTDVDQRRGVVKTKIGGVRAKHIVMATHTPKGVNVLQTGMVPSREYGVSARLDDEPYPEGIFWVLDPFHSIRSYRLNGNQYLIAVGEQHKTGETPEGPAYYDRLRAYLRTHFSVEHFEHQWSAQQYASADGLPYIGRTLGAANTYVATGFGPDGLTWGAAAGNAIADLVLERENPSHRLFSARRFTPVKSLQGWTRENVSVIKHLSQDYLSRAHKVDDFAEVRPGEGRLMSVDGKRLAVFRSQSGELTALSAVCPHLKCLVHWNGADGTWDCPCHGSRFGTDGSVIEGPAYGNLEVTDYGIQVPGEEQAPGKKKTG